MPSKISEIQMMDYFLGSLLVFITFGPLILAAGWLILRHPKIGFPRYNEDALFRGENLNSLKNQIKRGLVQAGLSRIETEDPLVLKVHRNPSERHQMGEPRGLGLAGVIQYIPLDTGVIVRLKLKVTNFVLADTGEGLYLERIAKQILQGDTLEISAPVSDPLWLVACLFFSPMPLLITPIFFTPLLGVQQMGVMLIFLILGVVSHSALAGYYVLQAWFLGGSMPWRVRLRRAMLVAWIGIAAAVAVFAVFQGKEWWESVRPKGTVSTGIF